MGTLEIIGIILIIAGIILVSVEMYIPGIGVPGITGAVCLIAGVFMTAKDVTQGILLVIIIMCILLAVFSVMYIFIFKARMNSPIVLDSTISSKAGYLGEDDLKYLLGKEGVAVTDLRPSGKGNFEGIEFDVSSAGNYIQKGTKIVICSIRDSRLTVKAISMEAENESDDSGR